MIKIFDVKLDSEFCNVKFIVKLVVFKIVMNDVVLIFNWDSVIKIVVVNIIV